MSYYYEIEGDIQYDNIGSRLDMWKSVDLKPLDKNMCINVHNNPNLRPKSGSQTMQRDKNEAMFIPKGYAIIGYDHENCGDGGRGAGIFHPYHNATQVEARNRLKAIAGGADGGTYSFRKDNNWSQDQPSNLWKKLSSWKVFDINNERGITDLKNTIDSDYEALKSNQGGVGQIMKKICENPDKDKFEGGRDSWVSACENELSDLEIKKVWPEEIIGDDEEDLPEEEDLPNVISTPDTNVISNPGPTVISEGIIGSIPTNKDDDNTYLYIGIGVGSLLFLLIIGMILMFIMKKKKPLPI